MLLLMLFYYRDIISIEFIITLLKLYASIKVISKK